MLNTIIFELILFAFMIIQPVDGSKEIAITNPEGTQVNCILQDLSVIDENDEHFSVFAYKITMKVKGQDQELIMDVKMLDNALYSVKVGEESPFNIDLGPYLINMDWENYRKKSTMTQDSRENPLKLELSKKALIIISKSEKISISIDSKYLKKSD